MTNTKQEKEKAKADRKAERKAEKDKKKATKTEMKSPEQNKTSQEEKRTAREDQKPTTRENKRPLRELKKPVVEERETTMEDKMLSKEENKHTDEDKKMIAAKEQKKTAEEEWKKKVAKKPEQQVAKVDVIEEEIPQYPQVEEETLSEWSSSDKSESYSDDYDYYAPMMPSSVSVDNPRPAFSRITTANELAILRRTTALTLAVFLIALLSSSVSQLRLQLANPHIHSYTNVLYVLIGTCIALEILTGAMYIFMSRYDFPEHVVEHVFTIMIFSLYVIAITCLFITSFTPDDSMCSTFKSDKKFDRRHSSNQTTPGLDSFEQTLNELLNQTL